MHKTGIISAPADHWHARLTACTVACMPKVDILNTGGN